MSGADTTAARGVGTGPAAVGALGVDARRMMRRIEALAAVDRREDGSCCRLALTDSDRVGRDLLVSWMKGAGLDVRIDPIGNIITEFLPDVASHIHIQALFVQRILNQVTAPSNNMPGQP